jgi:SAM-dependent methyltransferase
MPVFSAKRSLRKRDVLRHVPPFSKYLRYIEGVERENAKLRTVLSQFVFSDVTSLVETDIADPDGLKVPGAALRFMVVGDIDLDRFLHGGKEGARVLADIMARQGRTLDQVGKILDFGCGCGRMIRYLKNCGAEEIHGCDCNAQAIGWCQRFLEFATFNVNSLEPPLPYPDATFGLIYANSIFTHLPLSLQDSWMSEIRRVLKPGGFFLMTVHGRRVIDAQGPAARAAFARGELVVVGENLAGSNFCAAFHPECYVRDVLAEGFDVLDIVLDEPEACGRQDAYLLRLKD